MNTKRMGRVGLLILVGLTGCAGKASPTGESSAPLLASALPDVPACDAQQGLPHGSLTARPVAGTADLVLVYSDGNPLCIDALEEAAQSLNSFIVLQGAADSNPMPGDSERGGSNPMPGQPGDPAASNPMPGTDPADSNPMPGNGK